MFFLFDAPNSLLHCCSTVVDYVFVRRKVLSAVKDMKVIRGEACLTQHKLLVCVLDVKACLKRKRKAFVNRRRVWRLKDAKTKQAFLVIIKKIRVRGKVMLMPCGKS